MNKHYVKKANFWAKILVKSPGVSAIFLSGSLAQNKSTKNSDIDFFIITKPGQIFTARFFVAGLLKMFGVLADDAASHAGKICPNHYVTADNLKILEQDAYAAKLFACNKFLAGNKSIWYDFVKKNEEWIESFGEKFQNDLPDNKTQPLLIPKIGLVFQKIENWCRKFQINKLAKNKLPKTAKVWLTDTEIRLHAKPKNKEIVIAKP